MVGSDLWPIFVVRLLYVVISIVIQFSKVLLPVRLWATVTSRFSHMVGGDLRDMTNPTLCLLVVGPLPRAWVRCTITHLFHMLGMRPIMHMWLYYHNLHPKNSKVDNEFDDKLEQLLWNMDPNVLCLCSLLWTVSELCPFCTTTSVFANNNYSEQNEATATTRNVIQINICYISDEHEVHTNISNNASHFGKWKQLVVLPTT